MRVGGCWCGAVRCGRVNECTDTDRGNSDVKSVNGDNLAVRRAVIVTGAVCRGLRYGCVVGKVR